MKAFWNSIAAAVLVCAAVIWMWNRPERLDGGDSDRRILESRVDKRSDGRVAPHAMAAGRGRLGLTNISDDTPDAESKLPCRNPIKSRSVVEEAELESKVADGSVGVRLERNVRLPAVSFATQENSLVSQEIAQVMRGMENEFYRELLGRAIEANGDKGITEADTSGLGAIEPDESGESTVTVSPGAAVDAALDRSDEAFRSLFGNDAYNHRKMEGSMDAGSADETSGAGN